MIMKAARTAIGRVTLKAGGASFHVLHRRDPNEVVKHMRLSFASIAAQKPAPDGYVVCAFWLDKENPGFPGSKVSYHSVSDELTPAILCKNAAAEIAEESSINGGSHRALKAMGWEPESWEPDPAA
jgi:hypothetical protein